ncbi:MAG: NERD domain-containing protein [Desulfobacteraceae bacterium]|nr:MAG: NERD domain-containing protein [Desulfobacteraceae bacterium]
MEKDLFLSVLWSLGVGVATLFGWFFLGAVLRQLSEHQARKRRATPLGLIDTDAEKHRQSDAADTGVRIALGCLIATPAIFAFSYALLNMTGAVKMGSTIWGVIVGCLLCGYAFSLYKAALRRRREIGWYHEAKSIVDRAIAPLVPRGYIVFRDFKDDDIAIDHLLVGPKGVFALQTLVRPANLKQGQPAVATVTYDGRALFFPQGEEHVFIEQAEKHAENISEWISKRLGLPIAARGMVALPGWQVKRTSAHGISVINPAQFEALFQYIKPWPLSEDTLLQIVRLLENHYGNVPGIPIESVAGEGLPG